VNAFERQGGKHSRRHHHFAGCLALARESAGQEPKGATRGGIIDETNNNHGIILSAPQLFRNAIDELILRQESKSPCQVGILLAT
jgi:hypothetical protein